VIRIFCAIRASLSRLQILTNPTPMRSFAGSLTTSRTIPMVASTTRWQSTMIPRCDTAAIHVARPKYKGCVRTGNTERNKTDSTILAVTCLGSMHSQSEH
jgi:hypothetical protein